MASDHPYASFVHKVEKPARYLGGEYGAVRKDWDSVQAKVCLAFPDVYDIGMSHLGFKILYKILNDDPKTLAERVYAPWIDMERELRFQNVPLVSLESARKLSLFDVVGFSLQFELTYTNILLMLDLGGIPQRSCDRSDDDPLVIAGGPTATHPEPLAMFLDAVVIGDGEERMKEIALCWTEWRAAGLPRQERIRKLATLGGVYVPALYATHLDPDTGFQIVSKPQDSEIPFPVERTLVADLNAYPFPDDGPVGGPEAIFDRMSIEIARGCTEGCRFCQAGMIYRPVRERDPEQIVDTLVSAIKKSGYDEASITSLSSADYSCIAPLIQKITQKLAPEKVSLGVSSLRAYGLSENVLDDMQSVRASGVTFAPEAGSQRMRDVVNKNVTEEQLQETAERVFSRGWKSMKLYFMIGLPTEEEADVREIVKVGRRTRDTGRRVKREFLNAEPPTVTVSVSTHVPKPHTPFQWCAMDSEPIVRQKQAWLLEEVRGARGVNLRMHDSKTSWLEGVFARGDRSLGPVLEWAYEHGARFDSWEDQLKLDVWREAFDVAKIAPAIFLGTIPVTASLPWDHISVGLEEGFLAKEYRKALSSRLSVPCGKVAGMFVHHTNLQESEADTRKLVCYDCGVACDLSQMRKERLDYLGKMGAEAPRPPPARMLPVIKPADGNTRRELPRVVAQTEAFRYRFSYTKTGASAFLSHLDLIRALPRSFRRLGITAFYTQGFHPKPDMVFGPALQLGLSGLCEFLDIKLLCDREAAELANDLSKVSAEGLLFTGGVRLGNNDPNVTKLIDSARFVVAIPAHAGHGTSLRVKIDEFLQKDRVDIFRKIEGLGKKVNVRAMVRSLELSPDTERTALANAGLVGTYDTFTVNVRADSNGSARLQEVVEAMLGDVPIRGVRTHLGLWNSGEIVSPMNLVAAAALRAETKQRDLLASTGASAEACKSYSSV